MATRRECHETLEQQPPGDFGLDASSDISEMRHHTQEVGRDLNTSSTKQHTTHPIINKSCWRCRFDYDSRSPPTCDEDLSCSRRPSDGCCSGTTPVARSTGTIGHSSSQSQRCNASAQASTPGVHPIRRWPDRAHDRPTGRPTEGRGTNAERRSGRHMNRRGGGTGPQQNRADEGGRGATGNQHQYQDKTEHQDQHQGRKPCMSGTTCTAPRKPAYSPVPVLHSRKSPMNPPTASRTEAVDTNGHNSSVHHVLLGTGSTTRTRRKGDESSTLNLAHDTGHLHTHRVSDAHPRLCLEDPIISRLAPVDADPCAVKPAPN